MNGGCHLVFIRLDPSHPSTHAQNVARLRCTCPQEIRKRQVLAHYLCTYAMPECVWVSACVCVIVCHYSSMTQQWWEQIFGLIQYLERASLLINERDWMTQAGHRMSFYKVWQVDVSHLSRDNARSWISSATNVTHPERIRQREKPSGV